MNSLQIFKNDLFGEVRTMLIDDEPWFLGKDIATALGYKDTDQAIRKHVDDDDKVSRQIDGSRNMTIINESGMYSLIFGSKKPEAKAFKKWVTSEVLPQLRRTGVYITETATPEAISYEALYGVRRVKNTFRDTQDINQEYKRYKEMAKEQNRMNKLTNKQRITDCNKILEVIQERLIDNQESFVDTLVLVGLREQINKDMRELDNRRNGGIKSAKTKQINKLSQENVLLKEENDQWQTYAEQLEEYYNPQRIWYELPIHGFSTNFMFDENHNATRDYKIWLNKFPKALLPTRKELEAQGVCLNKRNVVMEIGFIHCEPYDVDNLVKSLVDVIFGHHLHINDNLIIKVIPSTIATCDTTSQGEIHFSIYNTDEVPHINSDTLYRVVNGRVELLNNDDEE